MYWLIAEIENRNILNGMLHNMFMGLDFQRDQL